MNAEAIDLKAALLDLAHAVIAYNRLIEAYGEDPDGDHIRELRTIEESKQGMVSLAIAALHKATGRTPAHRS
jgi:hypothetical protein